MNEMRYTELEERASASALRDEFLKLEARGRVHAEIERMKDEGKALVLTDEEERMLRSFRRFQCGCKPGAVFKWQTRPVEVVEIITDTGLIRDPQDISAG